MGGLNWLPYVIMNPKWQRSSAIIWQENVDNLTLQYYNSIIVGLLLGRRSGYNIVKPDVSPMLALSI